MYIFIYVYIYICIHRGGLGRQSREQEALLEENLVTQSMQIYDTKNHQNDKKIYTTYPCKRVRVPSVRSFLMCVHLYCCTCWFSVNLVP